MPGHAFLAGPFRSPLLGGDRRRGSFSFVAFPLHFRQQAEPHQLSDRHLIFRIFRRECHLVSFSSSLCIYRKSSDQNKVKFFEKKAPFLRSGSLVRENADP